MAPRPREREKAANGPNSKAGLGTFQGVFVPTSLNIFSILVFLRFGFILGQSGVIGFFGRNWSIFQIPHADNI
jgi:potassium/chloride transporter 9